MGQKGDLGPDGEPGEKGGKVRILALHTSYTLFCMIHIVIFDVGFIVDVFFIFVVYFSRILS